MKKNKEWLDMMIKRKILSFVCCVIACFSVICTPVAAANGWQDYLLTL